MHFTSLTLGLADCRIRGPTDLNSRIAIDILWSAALPHDRIEHIAAYLDYPDLHIGIFNAGENPLHARERARELIRRALKSSPLLGGAIEINRTKGN